MSRARRQRGFALLTVLWGTVALAGIAAGLIADSRTEARISRTLVAQATAQALADGALRLALLDLAARREEMPRDGRPFPVAIDGRTVRVAVQDVGGLADLNAAPMPLLAAAFRAGGLPAAAAETLARAAVARRRDEALPGGLPLAGAARPAHPFLTTGDLAGLPGMTADLLATLEPFVTVQSRRGGIDPRVAPAALLAALPGADPDGVADYVRRRGGSAEPPAGLLRTHAFHTSSFGDVFRITATSPGPASPGPNGIGPAARTAVVRLTGLPQDPVWIHDWRRT